MDIFLAILFLLIGMLLLLATLLIFVRVGFSRLESSFGIHGDGLPIGNPAPSWNFPDLQGQQFYTPTHDAWQFLIFADKSIAHFLSLVEGLNKLAFSLQELQILLISSDPPSVCASMVSGLGFEAPVVPTEKRFYEQFRVRVMPFGFLLDPDGIIRWCRLLNTGYELENIWKVTYQIASKQEASTIESVR
jgi:hypothetical protein